MSSAPEFPAESSAATASDLLSSSNTPEPSESTKRIGILLDGCCFLSAIFGSNHHLKFPVNGSSVRGRFVHQRFNETPKIVYHSHHATVLDARGSDYAQGAGHVAADAIRSCNNRAVLH